MRVFIGIKLNQQVLGDIEKFLKIFKKKVNPIRWVKSENIHITLKFIGEVSNESYRQIENCLSQIRFDLEPFSLKLIGCGKFGKNEKMNIFWIGIQPNQSLLKIYREIEESLASIGIKKEDRTFKPHITVGRNKKDYNFKSFFNLIEENQSCLISEMMVNRVQVFQSQLNPEGPIYSILKEIPIAKA